MKLTLSISSCPPGSNMEGQQYQFGPEGGTFGRSADNTWVLPDVSRHVSSLHARIQFESGQFILTDQSTNGVFVNGSGQPLGANNAVALKQGDTLAFGDYVIQVALVHAAAPVASTTQPDPAATQFLSPTSPASPSFDDLDKWLEPAAPLSEKASTGKVSFDKPVIQGSQALSDIDLGLKAQETDPLAVLGGVNSPSKSHDSNAGLSDLLGGSASLDQQMMKVPKIIPNDWDDLLGDDLNVQPTQTPVQPQPAQSTPETFGQASAPAPQISGNLHDVESVAEKTGPGIPIPESAANPVGAVSATPDLSEILATPAEKLQPPQYEPVPEPSQQVPVQKPPVQQGIPNEVPPSSPHVEGAAVSIDAGSLARELGLAHISDAQKAALQSAVVNTVKASVSGMMRTLRARSEIKSEFRMNMTTIQSAENNPLKFSVTPEDAIENMFAKQGKAYLPPVEAINDGFADISDHQVALFDAMKAAYEHILGQFDPDFLAQKFERTSSKRFLGGKGKNWDAYQLLYSEYKEDKEQTFKRLFGEVFADAYERRMHSLKMSRDHVSKK